MPKPLADLTTQELREFDRAQGEYKRLIKLLSRTHQQIRDHLKYVDGINLNSFKPNDPDGELSVPDRGGYLTTSSNSLTNSDYNQARNVLADVFAYLNGGNDIDGNVHTENFTDAEREDKMLSVARFDV